MDLEQRSLLPPDADPQAQQSGQKTTWACLQSRRSLGFASLLASAALLLVAACLWPSLQSREVPVARVDSVTSLRASTCPGTFKGADGMTYTCQHAIDHHWAPDCATVSTWDRATCSVSVPRRRRSSARSRRRRSTKAPRRRRRRKSSARRRRSASKTACAGTFAGDDGRVYSCQHAVDNKWAPDCETVSTWKDATCYHGKALPKSADIIIVGGGLVGSVVASQLAKKLPNKQILLLEAGRISQEAVGGHQKHGNYNGIHWGEKGVGQLTQYDIPGNYITGMHCYDRTCSDSWGKKTPYYQCKVLGGCGVVNGALMQIPHADNFANHPPGWKFHDLKPYYDRIQADFTITGTPSTDGKHYLDNSGANFVRRALQQKGFWDHTGVHPKANTFGLPTVSAANGVRQSTASVYLPDAIKLENFNLQTTTEVLQVQHTSGKATGVKVRDVMGKESVVELKSGGIVVMSAGALNTPRLLLASGLDGWGTVGKGVSDHGIKMRMYKYNGFPDGATEVVNGVDAYLKQYINYRSGPLTQFGPTMTAFFKYPGSPGGHDQPDVEIFLNPMKEHHRLDIHFGLLRPTCSNANLHLSGNENIDFAHDALYFGCDMDRRMMDYAVNIVHEALTRQGAWLHEEHGPWSFNHWVGSCALGSCADPESLRLKGTSNVAIGDASLIPHQVWAHPAFTLAAVGHKVADVLAETMQS
eukprot:TRINITY_DN90462_c0_g1_i1.p1 TRINITY_DN90462_c0_g1~~TRINITY_DN90462_c0_g1_i1.p1  ORF type:complete len:716 (+),score=97.93 TRINITY_DN90462_c0_g1_i1:50-2149(+)